VRPIGATSVDDLDPAALAPLHRRIAESPGSISCIVGRASGGDDPESLAVADRQAGIRFEAKWDGPDLAFYKSCSRKAAASRRS